MIAMVNDFEAAMRDFSANVLPFERLEQMQKEDPAFDCFVGAYMRAQARPPRNFCMFYFARGHIWARADGQPQNRISFPMSMHRDWFLEVSEAGRAATTKEDRLRWLDSAADLVFARRDYLASAT